MFHVKHRRRPRRPTTWPDDTPIARRRQTAVQVMARPCRRSSPRPPSHARAHGREPEGRRRQDDHDREPGRRAGPARAAGAGHRPRPAGQRVDGARASSTSAGTPSVYDVLVDGDAAGRRRPAGRRASPACRCVPATIDLAGAEIELVSLVARETRLRGRCDAYLARPSEPARLRPHRLPAVARPAHRQRPGRRRTRC